MYFITRLFIKKNPILALHKKINLNFYNKQIDRIVTNIDFQLLTIDPRKFKAPDGGIRPTAAHSNKLKKRNLTINLAVTAKGLWQI